MTLACSKKQEVKSANAPAAKTSEKAKKQQKAPAKKADASKKPKQANKFPKKFDERLKLVKNKLNLDEAQVKSIKDSQKVLNEGLKKCKLIKESDQNKACRQPLYKAKNEAFLASLNADQNKQFSQLRKKSEIIIP